MSKPESLAQLKDIHLPAAISWWPPAPGWIIILASLLFLAVGIIYGFVLYYRHRQARRQALRLLLTYQQEYRSGVPSQMISVKVSELLRRVALVYYPRKQVASLQGEAWLDFLNATGKNVDFYTVRESLLSLPYQENQEVNLKPLLNLAQVWIKQRGAACSN